MHREVTYECRRYKESFVWGAAPGHVYPVMTTAGMTFPIMPVNNQKGPSATTIHNCADEGFGVSDLIGLGPKKD